MLTLRLGIPTNARLLPKTREVFARADIPLPYFERCAISSIDSMPGSTVSYLRSRDLPRMVESGHLDLAITTHSMIAEANARVEMLLPLSFSTYRVVLASKALLRPEDLQGCVVATSLPQLARQYFVARSVQGVSILAVRGAVEGYTQIGVAQAVIDITETGTSLARNGLQIVDVIMKASAVLIGNPGFCQTRRPSVETLIQRLQAATLEISTTTTGVISSGSPHNGRQPALAHCAPELETGGL